MKVINKQEGFTLIEVIFSIAILSIVSVVVLRLFVVSHEINEESRIRDMGNVIATNTIEDIKLYRTTREMIEEMTWLGNDGDFISGQKEEGFEMQGDEQIRFIVDCRLEPVDENHKLYKVQVKVDVVNKEIKAIKFETKYYFKNEGE